MSELKTAYDHLFHAIETGAIKPGQRLLETELATQFGFSRTPIREAMRKLEANGIVQHEPRVGAVVRRLGQQEIVELYEMRIVLETTAAEMAAKHASASELRTLDALNEAMGAEGVDTQEVFQLNRRFHSCIMNAARNQFLAHSYNGLSNTLILLGKTTLESEARIALVTQQHTDIIAALRLGDSQAAGAAMRVHMETSLYHRLGALHLVE